MFESERARVLLAHGNNDTSNSTSKNGLITTTLPTTDESLHVSVKWINFQSIDRKLHDESIDYDTCDTMNMKIKNNIYINSTFHFFKGSLFLFVFLFVYLKFSLSFVTCFLLFASFYYFFTSVVSSYLEMHESNDNHLFSHAAYSIFFWRCC